MNKTEVLALLNKASRDELVALPGIGPALADRLLAARPFDSLEAAQAVKGIGANLLDRLATVESKPDTQPAPEPQKEYEPPAESRFSDIKEAIEEKSQAISKGLSGLGESVSKRGQAVRQTVVALPHQFEQTTKAWGPLWTTLVNGAVTALVAILLTLAVLGGINGSLKFATGSQYRSMQSDVAQISSHLDTLQRDMDGLRGRVGTLEGLGERTVALEQAQQQLAADLESASQQVTALQTEVAALNDQVAQQEERTLRFETFLQDLQTLLGNLFAPQGDNQ
ncbi:MAG: helix-hairpin-helix domain-containing protein [Chloroflexota bacterium]